MPLSPLLIKSPTSSTIVEEAEAISDAGLAIMACFYGEFRDKAKLDALGLLTSSAGSPRNRILATIFFPNYIRRGTTLDLGSLMMMLLSNA
jgi:hypothetical protein